MSLTRKTIYNVQRSSDGGSWEEVYISGSNLIIQTGGDGTITGSNIISPAITVYTSSYSSVSISSSYAIHSTFATSASYVLSLDVIDCGVF